MNSRSSSGAVSPGLRFLGALFAWLTATSAVALTVHVSPTGKDANDGASLATAVASLGRALSIARAASPSSGDVVVRFLPGLYGDQTLDVNWVPADGRRLILDGGDESSRARFEGAGSPKTWMQVRGAPNQKTNLTVEGFFVSGYRQAIVLAGDWHDMTPWLHGNVVQGNQFVNIGQHSPGVRPALAAIHMLNTSDSQIRGNLFRNIRNVEACDGLHALYLAGGSSGNVIEGNTFDGGCGDTIKVRDRSNNNSVVGNRFLAQNGKALFVDSFCDARKQEQCEGKRQECPSWGNVFEKNDIDATSIKNAKAVSRTVGSDRIPACPLPPSSSRIRAQRSESVNR